MLNIGVLGTGRIGKIHISNLVNHTQVKVVLVADPYIDEEFVQSLQLPFSRDSQMF